MESQNPLSFGIFPEENVGWEGPKDTIVFDEHLMRERLLSLDKPCYVVRTDSGIGITNEGKLSGLGKTSSRRVPVLCTARQIPPTRLGDMKFGSCHGTQCSYYAGSMAFGISSVEMIIALGRAGFMGSYGTGGVSLETVIRSVEQIQRELPQGPYAVNLINQPMEPSLEEAMVDALIRLGVRTIEASAFLELSPNLVRYRASGLSSGKTGEIQIKHRIIAKISRTEVAKIFMSPAPASILNMLSDNGLITKAQVLLAQEVPMADDVTIEADSGGHTDNRPLVSLLPSVIALRNRLQEKFQYSDPVRVGAAGGISTPSSALAAFMMGAAYVVTGSVNQACVEAGSSGYVKEALAEADFADVCMAPSATMFELGGKVQVLKKGTMFPMRAQKLLELYRTYNSIDDVPNSERTKLEKTFFKMSIEDVWNQTVSYFSVRSPDVIQRAYENPKRKMALLFRWYLGKASQWAIEGNQDRKMDYQIWCGPSIGPFNEWARGSYLEQPSNRRVVDVALNILRGAAYLYRLQDLRIQGLGMSSGLCQYLPQPLEDSLLTTQTE